MFELRSVGRFSVRGISTPSECRSEGNFQAGAICESAVITPKQLFYAAFPIRKFVGEMDAAWNQHDPDPGADYAIDADFVNVYGGWVSGREEFAKIIIHLHSGLFHNQTVRTTIERIHFIRPDVAIVIAKPAYQSPGESSQSRSLFVLTKQAGKWIGQAFQNTTIRGTKLDSSTIAAHRLPIAPGNPEAIHMSERSATRCIAFAKLCFYSRWRLHATPLCISDSLAAGLSTKREKLNKH